MKLRSGKVTGDDRPFTLFIKARHDNLAHAVGKYATREHAKNDVPEGHSFAIVKEGLGTFKFIDGNRDLITYCETVGTIVGLHRFIIWVSRDGTRNLKRAATVDGYYNALTFIDNVQPHNEKARITEMEAVVTSIRPSCIVDGIRILPAIRRKSHGTP